MAVQQSFQRSCVGIAYWALVLRQSGARLDGDVFVDQRFPVGSAPSVVE
jgi:hypothetical protein